MGQFFEYEMTVDSRDVDGWGRCRPSAVLGYLQEAATLAAEDGGFGREKTLEYHAFWMLARIWFRLDRPLRWEEKVTVRTWHRGSKTALMYRDFDLLAGGVPVGEAVSAWVLAGVEDRKLLRLLADRHVLVDDADAALPGDGDGHAILGDGIHSGTDKRDIQPDFLCQIGVQIHISGQHIAGGGDQQHVVKGKPLLDKLLGSVLVDHSSQLLFSPIARNDVGI